MKERFTQHVTAGHKAARCYYISPGERTTTGLLFLNGLYHGHAAWSHQQRYEALAKHRQAFVDYRGVGASRLLTGDTFTFDEVVDDVVLSCSEAQLDRIVVIGFSMGGMIAMRLAERFPELVQGLIILNSGARVKTQIQNMVASTVELLSMGTQLGPLLRMLYPWNHSETYLEKLRSMEQDVIDAYCRYNADARGFLGLLTALSQKPDMFTCCRAIQVPTLVIGSDGDEVFPFELQSELASNIHDCTLCKIPACGHSAFIESHQQVNERIVQFIEERVLQ